MTMKDLLKISHQRGQIQFPCVVMVTGRQETNQVSYLDYEKGAGKKEWIDYLNSHQGLIEKHAQLYIVTARSPWDFDSSMYPQDIKEAK
jgi:hypothetical protein